jgi:hypothetical protein
MLQVWLVVHWSSQLVLVWSTGAVPTHWQSCAFAFAF